MFCEKTSCRYSKDNRFYVERSTIEALAQLKGKMAGTRTASLAWPNEAITVPQYQTSLTFISGT